MTLAQMGLDKYKIDRQKGDKKPQNDHQNVDKPKRVRRTKSELIAAGYYDKDPQNKGKKHKIDPQNNGKVINPKTTNKDDSRVDRSHLFKSTSLTVDQLSEQQIARAKERGDENWESDFRNDYESGQKIYYVEINPLCHTKEILELYIGTVYSKIMVCWVDKGEAHSIGMDDADKIFRDEKSAKKYYSKVRIKE
jgi:hypothetical protein